MAVLAALHRTLLAVDRDLPRYMVPHGASCEQAAAKISGKGEGTSHNKLSKCFKAVWVDLWQAAGKKVYRC